MEWKLTRFYSFFFQRTRGKKEWDLSIDAEEGELRNIEEEKSGPLLHQSKSSFRIHLQIWKPRPRWSCCCCSCSSFHALSLSLLVWTTRVKRKLGEKVSGNGTHKSQGFCGGPSTVHVDGELSISVAGVFVGKISNYSLSFIAILQKKNKKKPNKIKSGPIFFITYILIRSFFGRKAYFYFFSSDV